jgi:hypothetical protein
MLQPVSASSPTGPPTVRAVKGLAVLMLMFEPVHVLASDPSVRLKLAEVPDLRLAEPMTDEFCVVPPFSSVVAEALPAKNATKAKDATAARPRTFV